MRRIAILYTPALHAGYLKFFRKYSKRVDALFILSQLLINELAPSESREIRAIDPPTIKKLIDALQIFKSVRLLDSQTLKRLSKEKLEIVTAKEAVSERLTKKYFPRARVIWDTVFLRWDEKSVLALRPPKSAIISKSPFDQKIMEQLQNEGGKTSDWWRRVGAAIVKGGRIILKTYNRHVPSPHLPYLEGDPRDFIQAGVLSHFSTGLHAEQFLVAEAARCGLGLKGANIYVTVFPCPVCAKLIAYSGIKRCYFSSGSASLDGERILKSQGVKIIQVV